jgi:putative cytotoxic protein
MTFHRSHPQTSSRQIHGPGCPAPNALLAFPNAVRVRPRGGRARWRDLDGSLLEWDSHAAALHLYGAHGWHLGEFDSVHGGNMSMAEPGRRIER